MQVVKAVCRCTFKHNSDELLLQCILCYAYSELLSLHPAIGAFDATSVAEEQDSLAMAGSEDIDIRMLRHHRANNNHAQNPLSNSRPADWTKLCLEHVTRHTVSDTLKLCDVEAFASLDPQNNPDGVVFFLLPPPAQLVADAVSCARLVGTHALFPVPSAGSFLRQPPRGVGC